MTGAVQGEVFDPVPTVVPVDISGGVVVGPHDVLVIALPEHFRDHRDLERLLGEIEKVVPRERYLVVFGGQVSVVRDVEPDHVNARAMTRAGRELPDR